MIGQNTNKRQGVPCKSGTSVDCGEVEGMERLKQSLLSYCACDIQEQEDRKTMLACMERYADILLRENPVCHFTASAWVTNRTREKVLMVYHNIYQSWSWSGGHADGEADLAAVALCEAEEETGVTGLRLLSREPISLEVLTVERHEKRGKYVGPHLHLNLTYLMEADEKIPLRIKEDENSAVGWFSIDEAIKACSEAKMKPIYEKLNRKLKTF